jgi:hypothetical protein
MTASAGYPPSTELELTCSEPAAGDTNSFAIPVLTVTDDRDPGRDRSAQGHDAAGVRACAAQHHAAAPRRATCHGPGSAQTSASCTACREVACRDAVLVAAPTSDLSAPCEGDCGPRIHRA